MNHFLFSLCILAFLAVIGSVTAQETKAETTPEMGKHDKPLVKKLNDENFQIGKIKFNQKTKDITFAATLGDPDSIIEYLMVTEMGKVHETLLITSITPSNLNIAMKLLGYKESKELFRILGKDYAPTEDYHQESAEVKANARFDIYIEWQEGNNKRSHHINELIHNSVTKKHAIIQPYVYGGAYLLEGRFKPDLSGDIIAIFTDRSALANFSNKGREDDTIWHPFTERLPQQGTPLTITFKKHKPLGN